MSRARDLADGTFSGSFSADSPTLVVDDANNRVGAGIASPSAPLHVAADSSTLSLRISGRSSDDRSDVEFYENDNTTKLTGFTNEPGYSLWSYGTRSIYTDSDAHIFRNGSATTLARLDSDGLKFNGDTAAANALDDYETGSWSPSVSNGSFQNVLDAHYIKIGNQVTVWLYAQSISDITTASNFEINNLPFTSSTDVDSVTGTVMLRYLNRSSSEQTNLISYMAQNGTTLRIYAVINNANYAVVRNSDFSNGNIGLRITLTYIAA